MTSSGLCYYFYQSMITFNFVQCYFGHAYSYCAAVLELPMTVCCVITGNLKAIAVEGEVLAAQIITENGYSSVIMTTNINTHTITFLFNFGDRTDIGFWGAQADVLPPLLLTERYILLSNYCTRILFSLILRHGNVFTPTFSLFSSLSPPHFPLTFSWISLTTHPKKRAHIELHGSIVLLPSQACVWYFEQFDVWTFSGLQ